MRKMKSKEIDADAKKTTEKEGQDELEHKKTGSGGKDTLLVLFIIFVLLKNINLKKYNLSATRGTWRINGKGISFRYLGWLFFERNK